MEQSVFHQILQKSLSPYCWEQSVAYLTEHLRNYLIPGEKVLICFLTQEEGSISTIMEQAVKRCGCVSVVWGPDHRWMTLLRLAFTQRVTAIIGPPLVVLGLAKLRKYKETPLSIRKVITTGYPCLQWMAEGIAQGLDCDAGGCLTLGDAPIVAGFACGQDWGVHLREDSYDMQIVDARGNLLPDGELGEMVLIPRWNPSLRYRIGDLGRISTKPCACGCASKHIQDIQPGTLLSDDLIQLWNQLQKWTSILDCRLRRGECGLEMEIVYFQGEKLPKLPTAAKMILRPWNPQRDEPFFLERM